MSTANHRCEGSLKQKVSIRYSKKSPEWNLIPDDFATWRLFKAEPSDYSDSMYLNHIAPIEYCPFCGEKLGD